uniref:NADH-ubiquinone oxidoreductase chain 6 n=1 Tax=Geocalamus acutus TaxID=261498 RepID=A1IGJ3_GEOAC|nr:NADH dehydrogenase subunit 6 [Geocalamus acutus]
MAYLMHLLGLMFVVSIMGVAMHPLPQFGAGGLVVATLFSCAMLALLGGSFISIVLLLIYLGGMLVVFAYSVALAVDACEVVRDSWVVGVRLFVAVCVIMWFGELYTTFGEFSSLMNGIGDFCEVMPFPTEVQADVCGVPMLYDAGWVGLILCVVCLFVCLFVVLAITRGVACGGLRVF